LRAAAVLTPGSVCTNGVAGFATAACNAVKIVVASAFVGLPLASRSRWYNSLVAVGLAAASA
jgi:hypothetical protein